MIDVPIVSVDRIFFTGHCSVDNDIQMSFRAIARNLVIWQRCFADAQHDIIIIPKRYRGNLMLLSLGWRFLKEESFRMTVMSFRVYTRNLVLLPLEKRFFTSLRSVQNDNYVIPSEAERPTRNPQLLL